jgi:hypothetical protein
VIARGEMREGDGKPRAWFLAPGDLKPIIVKARS